MHACVYGGMLRGVGNWRLDKYPLVLTIRGLNRRSVGLTGSTRPLRGWGDRLLVTNAMLSYALSKA